MPGTVEVDASCPSRGRASHSAATSSAVYSVPSSVLCVIESDRRLGVVRTLPSIEAQLGELLGHELAVRASAGRSAWRRGSAPARRVSSTATWAQSVHTTASAGRSIVASATMLAPVPLNVSSVVDGTEQVAEAAARSAASTVVAVGEGVALVGLHDRVEHRRVGTGRVVAGERAGRGGGGITSASMDGQSP